MLSIRIKTGSQNMFWIMILIGCLLKKSAFVISSINFNSSDLYLSDKFLITSEPRIRNYSWTVTNQTAAPDGFSRPVLVINSQFPGPLIEANEGDTLNIEVINKLSSPLTIHWHGIFQKGTPWMDGVTGVTQCPIPVGKSFTYKFQVKDQYGTFWYHAHTQNFAADGIAGPLIVHSVNDPLKRGKDFDQEMILLVNDWFHDLSSNVFDQLLAAGYNNSFAAPSANSALINGIGYFDCNNAPAGSTCQTPNKTLTIDIPVGTKTRFRLIGAGSHALFWFSVDEHTLKVVEADSTGVVGPTDVHRVPFHNGERYSVIIDSSQDKAGSSVYLRAAMNLDCFAWLAPGIAGRAGTALAILRFVSPTQSTANYNVTTPTSKDWSDTIGGACIDLDVSSMRPLVRQDACTNVLGRVYFSSSLGALTLSSNTSATTSRFFVNNTTWITHPNRPLLNELLAGGSGSINGSEVSAFILEQTGCYDIIINNLDVGIDHPYHLHGVDGWIVATGTGNLNETSVLGANYTTENPLRRDTQVVPGGNYHIVRVPADNPGVWILHCHIGWHLGAGFAGMIVMQPSILRQQRAPKELQELCQAVPIEEIDRIEPGLRKRSFSNSYFNRIG